MRRQLMRMPAAGSRPVITSQKASFVVTPTPSGVGHVSLGELCSGAATGGGGAGRACGAGSRVCAEQDRSQQRRADSGNGDERL